MFRMMLLLLVFIAPSLASAQSFYISPRIGDGSEANPYRAYSDPGAWSDCSPIGTRFICSGPSVPNQVGVIEIPGSRAAALTGPQKAALAATLGIPIKNTVEELLFDLVDNTGVKLRRDRNGRQHLKVHGVELASRPAPLASYIPDVLRAVDTIFHLPVLVPKYMLSTAVAWAASIASGFGCANNASLDCEGVAWDEFGSACAIVSNQAECLPSSTAQSIARATTAMATDDITASVDIVSFTLGPSTASSCGPMVRKDATADVTYYTTDAVLASSGELSSFRTARRNLGVNTVIASNTQDYVANDRLTVIADDNDITGKVNGIILMGPTTDGSPITGNLYAGIRGTGSHSTASTCVFDNFTSADYTAGRRPLVMFQ